MQLQHQLTIVVGLASLHDNVHGQTPCSQEEIEEHANSRIPYPRKDNIGAAEQHSKREVTEVDWHAREQQLPHHKDNISIVHHERSWPAQKLVVTIDAALHGMWKQHKNHQQGRSD